MTPKMSFILIDSGAGRRWSRATMYMGTLGDAVSQVVDDFFRDKRFPLQLS